ncbi:hypothetical protein EEB13_18980 [Rhodococcus sp. WS3]|uniref:nuclear transport factor 2 family protein n=1 Tax=unclassified Rhodococcus (in: high G+C Gram-positive bacteria) TaxID=192944 RepID=UPI00114438FE|nr:MULTISPECIES: hypothetical protein [unclassified Rhodococcus (in: high G+C Gram-positive bacteria)]ROZ46284.1 hypothetical protein EEB13_18980 [Rhodococcus sp. WS3]RZL24937.1 MAG: hypothetical protein EOP31_11545 [Rhodococcus sp. (in: high G+C Gram-positive bacteria)]
MAIPEYSVDQLDLISVVGEFYKGLSEGDTEALARLVEQRFATDAVLSRPESLPGGGDITGTRSITKFTRAAAGSVPISVETLMSSETDDGAHIFVEVSILIGRTPTRALEWWTFDGSQVSRLQAFYWDTAALVSNARPN